MYLYTLSMSKKINVICDKKYVPSEVATLVFVYKERVKCTNIRTQILL